MSALCAAIRATGAATSGIEVYLVNTNGKIFHDGTNTAITVRPADIVHSDAFLRNTSDLRAATKADGSELRSETPAPHATALRVRSFSSGPLKRPEVR